MGYLDAWRTKLQTDLHRFGELIGRDPAIHIAYGVVAGALLWPVRDDAESPELRDALTAIAKSEDVQPLLSAIQLLKGRTVAGAAQLLTERTKNDNALRRQLDLVIDHFRDDWIAMRLLRPVPADITINGSVEGANVVIGGVQYVAGDLIVTQTVQQKVRTCPTAPSPPSHFAGRREELSRLRAALMQTSNVAISGIQGMGGIGKTALALQLASEMPGVGAVLWASLGPEPAPANHLLTWARHADPDFVIGDTPLDVLAGRVQALLTDLVRDRCPGTVLLILDDVWEGASVAAARLLQKAVPLKAMSLITTRSQRVVAQLRSSALQLGVMTPADALQMLRNLLPSFPDISDAVLLDLAEAIGRHPLAMELAAGHVSLLERPESEIADLIATYKGGVPSGSPFRDIGLELGADREDNLELVLSFSYAALDEMHRHAFRTLGILAYGAAFDRPLCASIWSAEPKPLLDDLRHRALLGIADLPGWYTQHPLLRAYARGLLAKSGDEWPAASDAYAAHVSRVAEQFTTAPVSDWEPLEPYIPHVEEAGSILRARTEAELQRATPDEPRLRRALEFALHTMPLLANRRELEHVEWLEMGLAISRRMYELRYIALFLNEIGQERYFRGETHQAIQRWSEAYDVATDADDAQSAAAASTSLALFYLSSDPIEARPYLRRALDVYRRSGDRRAEVDALVLLAKWHGTRSHTLEDRDDGLDVLVQALAIAEADDYKEGIADATLELGRLMDTLGDHEEAIPPLARAAEMFHELRLLDREARAELFLASALANANRLEHSREHLEKALPLFKRTGDRIGQAVVLRNLAELEAARGERARALSLFTDALPLVRKVTMRFLDEDADETFVAPGFFLAQYEDVAKFELVEQFRANAARRMAEESSKPLRIAGFIPDDLLHFLLIETRRGDAAWPEELRGWALRLRQLGDVYAAEAAFADALAKLSAGDRGVSIDPADENPYASYVETLAARFASGVATGELLPADEVQQQIGNTFAVIIHQPEHRREWSVQLRKMRRGSGTWGDDHEHAFYAAQLAVIEGRLISLPDRNPYRDAIEQLQKTLITYQRDPLQFLIENTVAVKTTTMESADDWRAFLNHWRRNAAVRGETDEKEFIGALLAIAEDQPGALRDDNRYAAALARVRDAIANGTPLFAPMPMALLAQFVHAIVVARTEKPKTIDEVTRKLLTARQGTIERGNTKEQELFDQLLAILWNETAKPSVDEVYAPMIAKAMDDIARRPAPRAAGDTLPAEQITRMVDAVVGALAASPESLDSTRDALQRYRELLGHRNADWNDERAFLDALLALLAGEKAGDVPASYSSFIEQATLNVARHREIRAKGGNYSPAQLDALLRETAEHTQFPDFLQGETADLMQAMMDNRMRDFALAQGQWAETLAGMIEEAQTLGAAAAHEVELLQALLAVTNRQPASVDPNSPYSASFHAMLEQIEYSPGIPDLQTKALAMPPDEFHEHFLGLFTGRSWIEEQLDTLLMNTLVVMTTMPERAPAWAARLQGIRGDLIERSDRMKSASPESELEFLAALEAIVSGNPPRIAPDHPYRDHIDEVLGAIALHRGELPNQLPPEEIERLHIVTAGALTIGKEHAGAHQQYLESLRDSLATRPGDWHAAREYVNALLVFLSGRPVDLPIRNPYRPYLQMSQQQVKAIERVQAEG